MAREWLVVITVMAVLFRSLVDGDDPDTFATAVVVGIAYVWGATLRESKPLSTKGGGVDD